ncbi:2-hydroxyacid dehydrogenase [Mariniluteicoccus endophyticus]
MQVWLPLDDPADAERLLGGLPDGIEVVAVPDPADLPDDLSQVEFLAQPYLTGPKILERVGEMPRLRHVQLSQAGFEGLPELLPEGVTLHNAAGVHDASTAEHALGLALASGRHLDTYARQMPEHRWAPVFGTALADRRVLIIGAGRIGRAIEQRLAGFEVASVTKVARTARDDIRAIDDLDALLPEADVVFLICPHTDQTHHLMGARRFALLPDGALVVNVARGPVVDTDAMVEACASGRVRAAVDVTDPEPLPADHPLWDTQGVLVAPHVGGLSTAFAPRFHRLLGEQLRRLAAGEELLHRVH